MNKFGKYQVVEKIAQGGMAEVFMGLAQARDGTHRLVALKRLNLETVQDAHIVTMFEDEARVTSRIKHPNIVRTHEFFTDGENKVLAMEFIPGCDGRTVLECAKKRGEVLPELMALTITRDICLGLEHAHAMKRSDGSSLGLIHRDISPHNMLVGYNGKTKIIDFGIVKSEVNLSRTLAGAMKGKFAYMAPEQIMSKAMDHRVDVFALTASLFELLTNQRAFEAPNDFAVLEKIRLGEWGPLPPDVSRDPDTISRIIAKGLASTPDGRYATVRALRTDIDEYILRNFSAANGETMVKEWMRKNFAPDYANLKRLAQSALQGRSAATPKATPKERHEVNSPPLHERSNLPPPPPPVALNEANLQNDSASSTNQSPPNSDAKADSSLSAPTISVVASSIDLSGESDRRAALTGYLLVVAALAIIVWELFL